MASTINAKKPITTEGNPASSSMVGFMISFIFLFAKTAVYKAARIAIGAAKSNEMKVILNVPKIKARIPYRGLSETGTQSLVNSVFIAD